MREIKERERIMERGRREKETYGDKRESRERERERKER